MKILFNTKNHFMKHFYLLILFVALTATYTNAQLSLPIYEPFALNLGSLGGQNTWTGSAVVDQGAQVVDTTLAYPGLYAAPSTNGVRVGNQASGSVQQLVFTTQNTKTYASFLIRLSEIPPTLTAQTYYFAFGVSGTPSGTMYAIPNTNGTTFEIGFSTSAALPATNNRTNSNFQLGQTIMVVMAYTPGASGAGSLSAWVNPDSIKVISGATEPTPTFTGITGGTSATVSNVFIRSGANTRKMIFDELRIGSNWSEVTATTTVLPVTITDFKLTRKNNVSNLTWTSETEINFNQYVVLFSSNGDDFKEVGTVLGKGSNSKYSFDYLHIGEGYFKLKMIDKDGRFTYSNVLYSKSKTKSINIGPNPFIDKLNITDLPNGTNTAILYSMIGVPVKMQTVNDSRINLQLAGLPSGQYLLKIMNEGNTVYSTIVTK
jgi:hypothetical protein